MLTDVQEINTIELGKLAELDKGSRLWRWLRLLTLQKEDEMEEVARDNTVMKNVIVHLHEMSADEAERRLAEEAEKRRRDIVASRMYGEKKGREEGLKEGRKEVQEEIARKMKADGNPANKIALYTGLTEDAISAL